MFADRASGAQADEVAIGLGLEQHGIVSHAPQVPEPHILVEGKRFLNAGEPPPRAELLHGRE